MSAKKLDGQVETIKFLLQKHLKLAGVPYEIFETWVQKCPKLVSEDGTVNGLIKKHVLAKETRFIILSALANHCRSTPNALHAIKQIANSWHDNFEEIDFQ